MNKRCLLRKCLFLLLLLCMVQTVNASTVPVMAASAEGIQPMSDEYKWHYKTINGKRYKRLYNVTKHMWESDWIPV